MFRTETDLIFSFSSDSENIYFIPKCYKNSIKISTSTKLFSSNDALLHAGTINKIKPECQISDVKLMLLQQQLDKQSFIENVFNFHSFTLSSSEYLLQSSI